MVRAIRDSIVFSPPLVVTFGEIDRFVEILRRSLTEAMSQMRALSYR